MPAFKIFEVFKNLKSDAVPKPPRPSKSEKITVEDIKDENEENYEKFYSYKEPEDINTDPEDHKDHGKSKSKHKNKPECNNSQNPGNNVNVQATGPVINIVGVDRFHWGHVFVNHYGQSGEPQHQTQTDPETKIKKCNLIRLLMEANVQPDHEYIDYISKNLGKNWYSVFRKLGYSQGKIETFEMDEGRKGVAEARYKLLLDWIRNDDDGTLGCLAKVLWAEGERQIVKDLAILYMNNK